MARRETGRLSWVAKKQASGAHKRSQSVRGMEAGALPAGVGAGSGAPAGSAGYGAAMAVAAAAPGAQASPTPGSTLNILDQPLARQRGEVSLSAYLLLFCELVAYSRNRVSSVVALEARLAAVGYRVGERALEYVCAKSGKPLPRETRILGILNFVVTNLWRFLFGKNADSLKKVGNSDAEFYIEEVEPLVNTFVSVPKDFGALNCAAFQGGIVHGILSAAGFECEVTTYVRDDSSKPGSAEVTMYYIKFSNEVIQRERRLAG
ncbi:Trafficking protein particle complex subunit 5 [Porphyridium purpureum]|uniref:Trafficking protein particle complex subunit n=1 Tax=Porphyridium purpureum TaxID=35688 RepID=A0A5J4Z4A9_PORPP|nr:Trafficking protein particle complex subunit 5 [Porphyridium purpureum]|eukprot:POR5196..scf295_1